MFYKLTRYHEDTIAICNAASIYQRVCYMTESRSVQKIVSKRADHHPVLYAEDRWTCEDHSGETRDDSIKKEREREQRESNMNCATKER